jgi:hypothetical protein
MLWKLTGNGNVVRCGKNDTADDIYSGTYELAVKYFGINQDDIKPYGRLINIVIFQQTSGRTVRKLSNELFDILVNAQSEHKWWAPPQQREQRAIDTIDEAQKMGLIFDDQIVHRLEKSDRKNDQNRLYMFHLWQKDFYSK